MEQEVIDGTVRHCMNPFRIFSGIFHTLTLATGNDLIICEAEEVFGIICRVILTNESATCI